MRRLLIPSLLLVPLVWNAVASAATVGDDGLEATSLADGPELVPRAFWQYSENLTSCLVSP
jgi:hypothetical protein